MGPSQSGKTFRACEIVKFKDIMIEDGAAIKNVVFFYNSWQPLYDQLREKNIVTRWENYMPSNDQFVDLMKPYMKTGGSLCLIDDFESQINRSLETIVKVTSRHYNVVSIILFQSLYPTHRLARQISLNVKFLHIHKNPRENAQIQFLARQLSPSNYKWIVQSYHSATRKAYSSFLIDLTQEQRSFLRYRSRYLPYELPMVVYGPRGASFADAD